MIAAGIMIIGLCGTCTAALDGNIIWQMLRAGSDEGGLSGLILFVSAFVGGLPILGGVLLLWIGLKRYRGPTVKPPPSVPPPG
jgi:hypothetical protein